MTALAVSPLCAVTRAQGWQAARAAVHRHAPQTLFTPSMLLGSSWMYISLAKWRRVKGCINHDLEGWEWECGPQSVNIKITEIMIPVEVAHSCSVAATKGRCFRSMKYLTTMRMVWSAETCITPCSSEGSCRLAGQGHKGRHRIPEGLCLAFWLVLGFFLKKVFLGFLCLTR